MQEVLRREKTILKNSLIAILSLSSVLVAILLISILENHYSTELVKSHNFNYDVYDYFSLLQDAETGQRGYLLTLDDSYLNPYYNSLEEIKKKELALLSVVDSDPVRYNQFNEVVALKEAKLQEMIHTISLAKVGKVEELKEVLNSNQGQLMMTQIRDKVKDIKFREAENIRLIRIRYFRFKKIIYGLFIVALLVTAVNFYTLQKQIKPLIGKFKTVNQQLVTLVDEKNEEITIRKDIQNINEQLLVDLSKKNQELNHFAFIASHDLQEPLRTVKNFISLYKEEYSEDIKEDGKTYFDFIEKAVDRMSNLITGLLHYSRIGSSKSFEMIDLNLILQEVSANLSNLIEDKNAVLEIESLPVVKAFKIETVQIFQNLIQNAIKFCREKPVVKVGFTESKDHYTFFVKDNGIGMSEKDLTRIFNMFSRLNPEREFSGQGIGLAFCKKIAELHNGNIWAESAPGEGATFYFTYSKKIENVTTS
ncbi:MAG: CHASE3 domain-containing protein [Saprospiraceae bacterium]|nr:CHASE3 domain-containing protein [Saprospiraceae bacterium]